MNRPLWQRARKNFIKLVDDDKIPETHKRLNLHYLRTLPYEAISTAKPIIVEAPEPEPEPEPEPDVVLYQWNQELPINRGARMSIGRAFLRSDGQIMFGDLSDEELKARFRSWFYNNYNLWKRFH